MLKSVALVCFKWVFAGMDDPNPPLINIKDALKDQKRIKYHNDYLTSLLASIKCVTSSVRFLSFFQSKLSSFYVVLSLTFCLKPNQRRRMQRERVLRVVSVG